MTKEWIEIPLSVADKLGQWAIWAGAKLLIALPGIALYSWKQISRLSLHLAEGCERFYCKILIPLDAIPYGGMAGSKLIEIEARAVTADFEVCTNLLEVLEGKHGIVVGDSGDGKTTTVMYIAYSIGGTIKVYDADAAADEWQGLHVIGRCADFKAIDQAMQEDLEDLQQRTVLRGEKGSRACDGMDCVTIAEEFPLLVGEVPSAGKWFSRHGKRGRRVKKFILAVAQNDTAINFGIEGDVGVLGSFRTIRLGKKAQAHARKLKNAPMEEWLKGDRSRILVDDIPVQLPPYREIKRIIDQSSRSFAPFPPQLPGDYRGISGGLLGQDEKTDSETPKTTENQDFQLPKTSFPETSEGGEIGLLAEILMAFHDNRSDDWIAKNVIMASQSIGYKKARDKVESLRAMWGGK